MLVSGCCSFFYFLYSLSSHFAVCWNILVTAMAMFMGWSQWLWHVNESTWEHVHSEASVAVCFRASAPERIWDYREICAAAGVNCTVNVDKVMQEYLETSMAIDKITKEQVSEGTLVNGKGCTRADTPQRVCGCDLKVVLLLSWLHFILYAYF